MKGTPQFIMCGNSDRALRALREAGAPVTAVNILPDPAIRMELQELSGWPTIPQLFVKGELVGGADITQELAESGELRRSSRSSSAPITARRPKRRSSTCSSPPSGNRSPGRRRRRRGSARAPLTTGHPASGAYTARARTRSRRSARAARAAPARRGGDRDGANASRRVMQARTARRRPARSIRCCPSYQSCAAASIRFHANSSTTSSGASVAR